MPVVRFATLAALLTIAACGSTTTSSPQGGSSSAAGPSSSPSSSTAVAGCSAVTASEVGGALGITVKDPTATVNGTVTVCQYATDANPAAALVRFETGLSAADFQKNKVAFGQQGEPTIDVTGFGDAAYSSSIGQAAFQTNTLVVLKGSTQLLITAAVPLAKIEALATTVLATI